MDIPTVVNFTMMLQMRFIKSMSLLLRRCSTAVPLYSAVLLLCAPEDQSGSLLCPAVPTPVEVRLKRKAGEGEKNKDGKK